MAPPILLVSAYSSAVRRGAINVLYCRSSGTGDRFLHLQRSFSSIVLSSLLAFRICDMCESRA
jgi:hypothetical protein